LLAHPFHAAACGRFVQGADVAFDHLDQLRDLYPVQWLKIADQRGARVAARFRPWVLGELLAFLKLVLDIAFKLRDQSF
jgi:hypothetical protein